MVPQRQQQAQHHQRPQQPHPPLPHPPHPQQSQRHHSHSRVIRTRPVLTALHENAVAGRFAGMKKRDQIIAEPGNRHGPIGAAVAVVPMRMCKQLRKTTQQLRRRQPCHQRHHHPNAHHHSRPWNRTRHKLHQPQRPTSHYPGPTRLPPALPPASLHRPRQGSPNQCSSTFAPRPFHRQHHPRHPAQCRDVVRPHQRMPGQPVERKDRPRYRGRQDDCPSSDAPGGGGENTYGVPARNRWPRQNTPSDHGNGNTR